MRKWWPWKFILWFSCGVATLSMLVLLAKWQFQQPYSDGTGWFVVHLLASAGVLFAIAWVLMSMHRSPDGDDARGAMLHRDGISGEIRSILTAIVNLPDDAAVARAQIDALRPRYRAVSEALARQRDILPRQLEVQTTLGDTMVATERVWTTLADGAHDPARAAWAAAQYLATRVHKLLAISHLH